MSNGGFLLEIGSGTPQDVEQALRAKLPPQLDVRLLPLTGQTALLRGHLADAFRVANPGLDLAEFLSGLDTRARPIDAEQTLARLGARSPIELPAREIRRAARIDGLDWHLDTCNVTAAWDRLGGPDDIDWSVRVGQIDTGYTEHPALGFGSAQPWLQVADSETFVPDQTFRENWLEAEPGRGIDPLTGFYGGHGTRISSTICGYDPGAAGGAFYGVAPRVPLVMVRIADSVIVPDRQAEMAQALRYLSGIAQVGAINISLGFLPPGLTDRDLKRALSEAYEAGTIVVCAAGNEVDPVVVPARLNRTIAVAGVTRAEVPWSGSSYGPQVDFSAPAADLRRGNVKRGIRGNKYIYGPGGDGTSYAAAMTTGVAALWLQHRRSDLAREYPEPWQRVAAFRLLARSSTRVPGVTVNSEPLWQPGSFGSGILDADKLLDSPLPAAASLVREALP